MDRQPRDDGATEDPVPLTIDEQNLLSATMCDVLLGRFDRVRSHLAALCTTRRNCLVVACVLASTAGAQLRHDLPLPDAGFYGFRLVEALGEDPGRAVTACAQAVVAYANEERMTAATLLGTLDDDDVALAIGHLVGLVRRLIIHRDEWATDCA